MRPVRALSRTRDTRKRKRLYTECPSIETREDREGSEAPRPSHVSNGANLVGSATGGPTRGIRETPRATGAISDTGETRETEIATENGTAALARRPTNGIAFVAVAAVRRTFAEAWRRVTKTAAVITGTTSDGEDGASRIRHQRTMRTWSAAAAGARAVAAVGVAVWDSEGEDIL